jgi:glycosyltransferase involved in cell wall biosynthesis
MNTDPVRNKILMIINEFPPTGESGVQRPLKFLKYFSRENWQTYVITPKTPSKTVLDDSLLKEVPQDAMIFKTFSLGFPGKSVDQVANIRFHVKRKQNPFKEFVWKLMKLINDFIFPIDKQIGWVPFAYLKAAHIIRKYHIRNVYITAYPFSAFLIGLLLKKVFKERIFWVADYRDSWQFDTLLDKRVHKFRMRQIRKMDELTLKKCDEAIFCTEYQRNQYCEAYAWVTMKSMVLTNGYDEDDFLHLEPVKYDKFTILFMGKTYLFYVSPIPLLKAIQDAGLPDFQYVQIGSVPKEILDQIRINHLDFYHFEGYKPHAEALNYATGADINTVILNSDEASKGIYSGKIFELLRIGRPILVVGPETGVVKDLIERIHAGKYACINNPGEIIQCVRELAENPQSYMNRKNDISMYSREYLTKRLISIYEKNS